MGVFTTILLIIVSVETLILVAGVLLAAAAFKAEKNRQQQEQDSLENYTAAYLDGMLRENREQAIQKNSCSSPITFNISEEVRQEAKTSAARLALREFIKINK